jgi:8-oxo-dGTP diphosphatase
MPIRVVTGLLIKDGKVLMCQRHAQKEHYPFHWEFPGGKVEAGETLFQALQRELREELKISVSKAQEWFEDTMLYSNGADYHVTFFLVRDFLGEPVNTEFEKIGWFTLAELKPLQHLSGNANILRKIQKEGLPE